MQTKNPQQEKQGQRRGDLIGLLQQLSGGERTALKRSLGKTLAESKAAAWEAFFKVAPSCPKSEEAAYFVIAAGCSAFRDVIGSQASFVYCLAILARESEGIRKRFLSILDTPWDDSGFFEGKLSGLLRIIKQKGGNVDFSLLLRDLLAWNHESRHVQVRWAKEFFSVRDRQDQEKNKEDNSHAH